MSQFVSSMFAGMNGASVGGATGGDFTSDSSGGGSGDALAAASAGTSMISALSSYAQGRAQAQTLFDQAASERMAATGALLDAQQKATAISDQYNQTIADQFAVASASGYDVGSLSVGAARTFAQGQADRATDVIRQSANMEAALRRARAYQFDNQAHMATEAGAISGVTKFATGLFDIASIGGGSGA